MIFASNGKQSSKQSTALLCNGANVDNSLFYLLHLIIFLCNYLLLLLLTFQFQQVCGFLSLVMFVAGKGIFIGSYL